MQNVRAILALSALILTGCGSPPAVKIDSSEASDFSQGNQVVGLLEVHNVNTGDDFGMRLKESYNESFYCTVSVLNPNTVVTSTDCLQTVKQNGGASSSSTGSATSTSTSSSFTMKFQPEDMTIHLPVPGRVDSTPYSVLSIAGIDGPNHLAYLRLTTNLPGVSQTAAIALQASTSKATVLSGSQVSGIAVSATAPDADGISHLRRSNVTLAFTAPAAAPVSTATGTSTSTSTSTSTTTTTSTSTATATNTIIAISSEVANESSNGATAQPVQAPATAPLVSASAYSQPQPLMLTGLKDGSFGAPVFFSGTMVGIVQNPSSDNSSNGQWIVASPGSTALTP